MFQAKKNKEKSNPTLKLTCLLKSLIYSLQMTLFCHLLSFECI